MAIAPGDDITGTPEPLPRDSLTNRLGGLARGWINYFQGKDRLTGEILSGVNRNRQNIVQLQTDYTAADGAVSSAYITADAVVAADASGARATLSTTLVAAYEAADSAIQGQVTTNAASIVTEQSVRASGDAANASSITTLEAAYEAADSAIQGQVTTNAASIVTEESARASGDSANASSITTLEAQVATNEAHVQQIAEAYATDSSATARLVWTVNTTTNAATIEQTAAEGYVDGTWNGSAINLAADQITLLAEDINFGSQTAFDTATETFITEVGSIRSRYGTAFGASSDLIRWDGPVAVTQGSETPTNGYLAITTSGAIYKDDAALGWGATAAEAAASNAQVGTGANSLVDTGFRQPGSDYWQIYDNSAGSLGFSVLDYDSGIRVGQAVGAGFTSGQYILVYAGVKNKLSVKPGDRVGFRCLVGGASLSSIRLRILFQDDAGAVVSVPESTPRTTGILTGAGEADFFTEESLVVVAPALATRARVDVLGYVNGASPSVRLAWPTMAILQTGQTVAPPLQRGFDAAPGSDVTGDNTAGGIDGQGALATANTVGTATIDAGAVNGGAATETAASVAVNSATWVTLATQAVTVPTSAQFVLLKFSAKALALGTYLHQANSNLDYRITRNGTEIYLATHAVCKGPTAVFYTSGGTASISGTDIIIPGYFESVVNGFDIDFAPGSGTVTYVFQARRAALGSEPLRASWDLSDRKLLVDVRKR